jgi:hypothetical protein
MAERKVMREKNEDAGKDEAEGSEGYCWPGFAKVGETRRNEELFSKNRANRGV